MTTHRNNRILPALALASFLAGAAAHPLRAQDLEPRRWSHLPVDLNYAGAFYGFTAADIFFDPVLELEDVELDLQTVAVKYIRTFELLERSARLELGVPFQDARWDGLLQGQPASTVRQGFADPVGRFALTLHGAPPLKGQAFGAYRAAHPVETIVGAALNVQAPFGEYREEKLLNLGENRYTVRPEIGVEHARGRWITELTGSVAFFTENDEFWKGTRREQDPMYIGQGHLCYVFRPGLWISSGVGYGYGGESTINDVAKNDTKGNLVMGASLGVPINRAVGAKIGYIRSRAQKDTGSDSDTFVTAVSAAW